MAPVRSRLIIQRLHSDINTPHFTGDRTGVGNNEAGSYGRGSFGRFVGTGSWAEGAPWMMGRWPYGVSALSSPELQAWRRQEGECCAVYCEKPRAASSAASGKGHGGSIRPTQAPDPPPSVCPSSPSLVGSFSLILLCTQHKTPPPFNRAPAIQALGRGDFSKSVTQITSISRQLKS